MNGQNPMQRVGQNLPIDKRFASHFFQGRSMARRHKVVFNRCCNLTR